MISKKKIIENLDILAYYSQYVDIKKFKKSSDWYNGPCPWKKNTKKAFGFNIQSGSFKDFRGEQGSIFDFDMLINKGTEKDAIHRVANFAGLDYNENTLEDRIKKYHKNLLTDKNDSLAKITQMGISQSVVIANKIGYMPAYRNYPEKFVFPIYDIDEQLLTYKQYNSNSKPKCLIKKGSKNSLYGVHQIKKSPQNIVVLCAGEKDKLVAESHITEGYTFATFTTGEGSIPHGRFLKQACEALKDRDVIVVYDADEAGEKGAKKVWDSFSSICKSIKIASWPEDFANKYPKGDITDFLVKYQASTEQFIEIMRNALPYSTSEHLPPIQKTDPQIFDFHQCGPVIQSMGMYAVERKESTTPISNFIIVPQKIIKTDLDEIVECMFVHESGETTNIAMSKLDWNNKKEFLKKIPSTKYWFAGKDQELQYIKGIVGRQRLPIVHGTHYLGYFTKEQKRSYVLPEFSIGDKNLSFIPQEENHILRSLFCPIRKIHDSEKEKLLAGLFPAIYNLHEINPLLCTLGWFFSTPFKPMIMNKVSHFPILAVAGARGSGKTTLISKLWQIFGFRGDMFSVSQSPFCWIKALSSTNCFPLCFDEFKTSDLHQNRIDIMKQLIRKMYNGGIETRGRADQSTVKYPLQAPTVILGESFFQDSAILERLVPISLSFSYLQQHDSCITSMKTISNLPLQAFLTIYLEWCLQQDFDEIWSMSENAVKEITENCKMKLPSRIQDNIIVVVFGIYTLTHFANDHNLETTPVELEPLMQYFTEETMNGDSSQLALDVLIEKLADMAERGSLRRNTDYTIKDNLICLRLEQCVDAFRRWAYQHQFKGEVLEYKSYQKMLKDRLSLYVEKVSATQRFGKNTMRCITINIEKAQQAKIRLEGFFVYD